MVDKWRIVFTSKGPVHRSISLNSWSLIPECTIHMGTVILPEQAAIHPHCRNCERILRSRQKRKEAIPDAK